MDTSALKRYCASFPAAEKTLHGEPSNILVYSVGGKTFAYFKTSEPERWRFSFRATPERFVELTDQPGIKPARWMGRWYWVTIVDVQRVPEGYLRELVAWSYRRALGTLSRKRRIELVGDHAYEAT